MKILIVRFSSIGDIILTTPVIRCLKKQLAGVTIHYLTKNNFAGILKSNPYVDKVIEINKSVDEVIPVLQAQQYDYIIDLHKNKRTQYLKLRLKGHWTSFKKLSMQKLLHVNFKINVLPSMHIVDRYMQTVKQLGVSNDNQGLDFFTEEDDEKCLNDLSANQRSGYMALVCGAKHYTKRIPVNKLIDICGLSKMPVVLLGGKDDVFVAAQVEKVMGDKVFNACGKYTLSQSAVFVRESLRVITPDTGLMHIASAYKKNITSVWGNTIPGFGMYPYLPGEGSRISEITNLFCRPCSKLGYEACPLGHFKCMQLQQAEDIMEC